jgi:hypothetical protein
MLSGVAESMLISNASGTAASSGTAIRQASRPR